MMASSVARSVTCEQLKQITDFWTWAVKVSALQKCANFGLWWKCVCSSRKHCKPITNGSRNDISGWTRHSTWQSNNLDLVNSVKAGQILVSISDERRIYQKKRNPFDVVVSELVLFCGDLGGGLATDSGDHSTTGSFIIPSILVSASENEEGAVDATFVILVDCG